MFGMTKSPQHTGLSPSQITLQSADVHCLVTSVILSIPANQALHCHVDTSLGQPPHPTWKPRPGRSRNSWLEQICQDSGSSTADVFYIIIIIYYLTN